MRIILLLLLTVQFGFSQTWFFKDVGIGIKSGIVVDNNDYPTIAYMTESTSGGYIRVGSWNNSLNYFDTTQVATGYFYGPLDITMDLNDEPHIVTHYHQGSASNSILAGELYHVYENSDTWYNEVVIDTNHDGWDADIIIDQLGKIHVASIDPSQAGSTVGLEYNYYNGSFWTTEKVGTEPLQYAYALSIDLDSTNDPHITYYEDIDDRFSYAFKKNDVWTIETIDSIGDPGRFSSLIMDANSIPHTSYISRIQLDSSQVKYAWRTGGVWETEVVDTLINLNISSVGARKSTAIQLNSSGQEQIVYGDLKLVKLATRISAGNWIIDTIVDETSTSVQLGQQVDFVIDSKDDPHITYFERTTSPSPGIIKYVSTSPLTSISTKTSVINGLDIAPNISESVVSIIGGEPKQIAIYNSSGVQISFTLIDNQIDISQYPSGLYFVHLTNSDGVQVVRKLIRN